jgi:hypothetical protein
MKTTKKYLVRILALIFISMISLAACQSPVAATVPFDQACQVENDQQWISTDGYFSLKTTVYCSSNSGDLRCGLVFNSYPDGNQEFTANLREGNRKNMMRHLESGYLEADLQIKTNSGEMIGVGQHLTLTGKMDITQDTCTMNVDKIELYEPVSTP